MGVKGKFKRVYRLFKGSDYKKSVRLFLYASSKEYFTKPLWNYYRPDSLNEQKLIQLSSKEDTFFDYYDGEIQIDYKVPITPQGSLEDHKQNWSSKYTESVSSTHPPFVTEIRNPEILGPEAVIRKNGQYIRGESPSVLHSLLHAKIRKIWPGHLKSESTETKNNFVFPITGPLAKRYFHWLIHYLPRLEGLEYYTKHSSDSPTLLIPSNPPKWLITSLRLMGYQAQEWEQWGGGTVSVPLLLYSSVHHKEEGDRERRVIGPRRYRFVADRLKKNASQMKTTPHSSRIYISRNDANNRRISNENQVIERIRKWGFKKYLLTDMDFEEQITLFSNADVIISPHGAGLTNMIFSTDASIIEILGPKRSYKNPGSYFRMANTIGHDYACIESQVVGPDIRVDIDELKITKNILLNY